MNQEIINLLNNTLDVVLEDYLANQHVIFESDVERKREQYKEIKRRFKEWNKSKMCIFRGCSSKSIRRSHTIQKSGSLKAISINSTILTPQFNHEVGDLMLVPKGLSQASVFPGFCSVHELSFSKFENNKSIDGKNAILLQIYRSICREVVRLSHELRCQERLVEDYIIFRNMKFVELLSQRLGNGWLEANDVSINDINIDSDPFLVKATKSINDARESLREIKEEHLREIEEAVAGSERDALRPVVIKIDALIPVALSGMSSFYIKDNQGARRILAIIGVFPSSEMDATHIVIHGKLTDTSHIHEFVSRYKNSLDILNMVEQFMIRGTDHWFLSPQVWEKKLMRIKNLFLRKY